MNHDTPILLDLLSPSVPSVRSVLGFLDSSAVDFTPQDLDGLLEKWTKWPSTHKETQDDTTQLVSRLMSMGADPWRVDGLIGSWVKQDRLPWVRLAFEAVDPASWPQRMGKDWLHECVERSSPMVDLLLAFKAPQVRRSKDGSTPLHLATSSAIVAKLCDHGAHISALNYKKVPPLESWGDPFAGRMNKREMDSLARRVSTLMRNALLAGKWQEPGLASAPLLLAACGRWKEATVASAVVPNGMEMAPYPIAKLGMSPLSGWAFSILEDEGRLASLSGGRAFVERCFADRNGTWDHEWVLASAALQHLTCAPWFKKSISQSVAYEKMHAIVANRLNELAAAPGLEKGWNDRLSPAVEKFKQSKGVPGWEGALYRKASFALVAALARGDAKEVAGLSVDCLNGIASSLITSSREDAKRIIADCWKAGIPEAFWASQGEGKVAWLENAPQEPLIECARKRLERGQDIPSAMTPRPNWPRDVLTMVEARNLSGQTAPAAGRSSLRRM